MLSAIKKRYAVRKYQSSAVSEDDINSLVAAFQAAPCAMHQTDVLQGIVVTDPHLRKQIEEATDNACYGAPLLFVLNTKKDSQFGERDASAAAENIMIQAADLDLGSVYVMGGAVALNKQTALLEQLGVPDNYQVSVIVPVGKAAEQQNPESRNNRYQLVRK